MTSVRRIGLARALSKLGYCSRVQAATLIRAGRVALNGSIRRNPEAPVDLPKARIEVDGRSVMAAAKVYLMFNKPRGVVTTAHDEKGRPTVYGLLDPNLPWLAPVGRLDKASEGLLLLTNDSEWGAQITAPETHLEKTYHVQVSVLADAALMARVRQGVRTTDGDFLRVRDIRILRGGQRNTWLEMILEEGRNRHIRRIFEELDVEVLRLVRVAIGPLTLGDLPKAQARHLTREEKETLDRAMARVTTGQ